VGRSGTSVGSGRGCDGVVVSGVGSRSNHRGREETRKRGGGRDDVGRRDGHVASSALEGGQVDPGFDGGAAEWNCRRGDDRSRGGECSAHDAADRCAMAGRVRDGGRLGLLANRDCHGGRSEDGGDADLVAGVGDSGRSAVRD
jgi:hypothetical protein